ncbi:Sulfotransferase [Rhynchospora pubera]|uniref:Sulfotransferase n=1 Tax=Rhynchospora pubera TaxID=906938 RepID=A0AAV8G2U5_9POAL|nr:Sulfotransferase [Rhynchospora pubera]KAJ4798075.1 Sulfotransferase [Rhynchospora pubera]
MASYDSKPHADFPIPYKTIEEANSHLIEKPTEEHDAVIATFPLQPFIERPFTFTHPFRLYKGVWISELLLRGILEMQQRFKSRPTDIYLASSPKSGTTWLKAMIFATLTRTSYPLSQHPLHTHNPHQCVPHMERKFATGQSQIMEVIPSPRVMSTHMPYSLLSEFITDSDCRIVYVWRDPKDVLVSLWFFVQKIMGGADKVATFDQFYDLFCQGVHSFGPIWNHVLGYWEESKRRPEKVLFLKYEHILQDPVKHAKQLAHFMGCPYTEAEENDGVVEQIVKLCNIKTLKDLDVNKGGDHATSDGPISHAYYFRKGEAGDWKSHMTREMAERLNAIIGEKFKGSGLQI